MYESTEKYLKIVRQEVQLLEKTRNCRICDGTAGLCPRCGACGTWDIETKGFIREYGNSIYYSTVFYDWRCRACDIRKLTSFPLCRGRR